jgi:hypothetical protein
MDALLPNNQLNWLEVVGYNVDDFLLTRPLTYLKKMRTFITRKVLLLKSTMSLRRAQIILGLIGKPQKSLKNYLPIINSQKLWSKAFNIWLVVSECSGE